MDKSIKPNNLPETVVWYFIVCTYPIYLIGGHYFFTAFMGCFLLYYLACQWWRQTDRTPVTERIAIAPIAWAWLVAMIVVELALIVGHLDFELSLGTMFKSSSHWFRTWAVFGIFPLAGHLQIRPQIVYRAICILCLQSIAVIVLGTALDLATGQEIVYVSPLSVSGGDVLHYQAQLIQSVIDNRLELFAPWSTALGMMGNTYLLLASQESDRQWRTVGIVGSIMMIIFSWSRLAVVSLFFVPIAVWFLSNLIRPWMQLGSSVVCFLSGLLFTNIVDLLGIVREQIDSLRADTKSSSNTREEIYQLTLYRWRTEAPIWGRGVTEDSGPAAIDRYPIASHQTWFHLLYAHGLVGFVAYLIVAVWTLIDLTLKAQSNRLAKVCLGIFLVMMLNTLTDNIQSFAYLYWPSLLMLGILWRESVEQSQQAPINLHRPIDFYN